jgi:PAS domain S-box-containing protein
MANRRDSDPLERKRIEGGPPGEPAVNAPNGIDKLPRRGNERYPRVSAKFEPGFDPANGPVRGGPGLASTRNAALKHVDQPLSNRASGRPARRARPAHGRDDLAAHHYQAIIESSDDAILSKDLNGVILSWNQGAERLFGFSAEEAVGKPVTLIIPMDRLDEEPAILAKIHRGERIEHFETVRQRKDGSLIDISLTISPIRNSSGKIVGASKIARDRQHLLMREMSHRVKNLFALCGSIVGLSARSAKSPHELAESARARLSALARAHALTFSHGFEEDQNRPTTLQSLVGIIVAPFDEPEASRIALSGIDAEVSGSAVTSLALLLHEFATNATKYGALSTVTGTVEVVFAEEGDAIVIHWTERGGPLVVAPDNREGFGAVLSRIAASNQLGGEIVRDWRPEGLAIRLSVPRSRLTD